MGEFHSPSLRHLALTRPRSDNTPAPVRGILISGLRRSGSTILWETFRRDHRNLCFDEPFHPLLWEGMRENVKGTWPELSDLWRRFGGSPVAGAAPISPIDELDPQVSSQQREYLSLLFQQKHAVVVDEVRAWNKLPSLLVSAPDILVIHLVRSPRAWVSAQLLPSGSASWRRRLSNTYRRASFFRRSGQFDNWHYEEIIEEALRRNHPVFRYSSHDAEDIMRQPAHRKLLTFWWTAVQRVNEDLLQNLGIRFMTVTLEEFSKQAGRVIERVYSHARWPTPSVDYDHVTSVNPGWQPNSKRWSEAFEWVGIPKEFMDSETFTGQGLERTLNELKSIK